MTFLLAYSGARCRQNAHHGGGASAGGAGEGSAAVSWATWSPNVVTRSRAVASSACRRPMPRRCHPPAGAFEDITVLEAVWQQSRNAMSISTGDTSAPD